MIELAVVFLVLALVAGVFGFGGFAVAFAGLAKFLLVLFLVLFLVALLL